MNHQLKVFIQQQLQAEIINITTLSGGMISEVLKIDFQEREPLVAKLSNNSHDLSIEGYMLRYLKQQSQLPIPDVLYDNPQLLLIEYIDSNIGLNIRTSAQLGEMLAQLHQITSTHYGHEQDTLIGPIHQPNTPSRSWIDFFREYRLLYMCDIALESGNLPQSIYDRLQNVADQLHHFIIEPTAPVLIHGDMWSSNILVKHDNIVGIIDPALYYAHHEMELAYMTLFGTPHTTFFKSYQQSIPIDKTFFEVRRHIYGLYPLLVHVTLFGGSYANMTDATLKRLGF